MIEKKTFTGGLSTDTDAAYIAGNQYLNALNVRVSADEERSMGAMSNVKGNEKVTFTMPSGTNTCIGHLSDDENSRVYYFVHNSNDDHMVLCYFHKEDTIRKVIEQDDFPSSEEGLNFSLSYLITGVGLNDDLLFFTDNNTEPKRINVERGLKKHDSSYTQLKTYDTYAKYGQDGTDIRDTLITVIRQAPTLPLTTNRFEDAAVDYNFIADESFTFAYRFVYADGEVSTLSPYSEPVYHANPDTTTSERDFNTITVTVPADQAIGPDVIEVEYLVKYNNESAFSIFYIEKDYNAIVNHDDDGVSLKVQFRNDTARMAVAESEVTRYFSAVPVKAKGLECARGRVFMGNTTEGLNNLNEDGLRSSVSISPHVQNTSGNLTGNYVMFRIDSEDSNGDQLDEVYVRLVKVSGSTADGYYTFSSNGNPIEDTDAEVTDWETGGALNTTRWPATQNLSSQTNVATTLNAALSYAVSNFAPADADRASSRLFETAADTSVTVTGLTGDALTYVENLRLWKSGSSYRFGLVFADKYGRLGRVIEITDTEGISIPTRDDTFTTAVEHVQFSMPTSSPQNYIPDWAHSYHFVRSKSLNKSFFVQFAPSDLHYVSDIEANNQSKNYTEATHQYIQVHLDSMAAENFGYNLSEGDLINLHNLPNFSGVATLRVLHQTAGDLFCSLKDLGSLTYSGYPVMAEIFTPRLENSLEPFHEFGYAYKISSPGTSSRSFSTTSGNFDGDVVVKMLQYGTGSDIVHEVTNPDYKKANTWIQVTGRAFGLTRFQQVHKPTGISFSERRVQGSLLNGLSVFNSLDENILASELGSIQKLVFTSKTESEGNTMLAIGTNETASVYIGEAQLQTSGGAAFLAVQSGVIGSAQVLRGSYGTLHPESVVESNNRVFFYDALNGTVVLYDRNGLLPIGDRGIKSFFRNRSNLIVQQGTTGCFGGYDNRNDEYILHLAEVDSTYEYLEDYIDEVSTHDLLDGFQDPSYNGVTISVTPAEKIKKNRKYRLELHTVSAAIENFDAITAKYSDDSSIGDFSAVDDSGYIEFTATKDSTTLKFTLDDSTANQTPDAADTLHVRVNEFRSSYYDLENGDALTLAYDTSINAWTSRYSYEPEQMAQVGTEFLSFKSGELWVHDASETRNNFYGTQYNSQISGIVQQNPMIVKRFNGITIEGNYPPSFIHFRTEAKYMDRNSSGEYPTSRTYSDFTQSSDLSDADFRQYEGVYYAPIYRNRLEPAPSSYVATTYDTNGMTGEKLLNPFLLFMLEFDETNQVKVRFADIAYSMQKGHKTA